MHRLIRHWNETCRGFCKSKLTSIGTIDDNRGGTEQKQISMSCTFWSNSLKA